MSLYDYSKISEFEKMQLPSGFSGNVYNLSYKWQDIIGFPTTPYKILEIGAHHGANTCSLFKTFARHTDSEVHTVDPWADYPDYNEYQKLQDQNYSLFLQNVSKLPPTEIRKLFIHRELSDKVEHRFTDNYFDIIYIDGNHEIKWVLHDALLALKKVTPGGWLIFDDAQDPNVITALNIFLQDHKDLFESEIKCHHCQIYLKRKSPIKV
jgi:hypothetical protein